MSSPPDPRSDSSIKRAFMLGLKMTGGAAWLAAYRQAIYETRHNGDSLLPRQAITVNLAWEALYTAGGLKTWRKLTLEDKIQTVMNAFWLLADIAWLRESHRKGVRLSASETLLAFGYQLAWLPFYKPGDAARRSALLQNLGFSIYCAIFQKPSGTDQERKFTLYRGIGTLIPTLTSGILRGYRPAYMIPGLGCILFDSLRIIRNINAARNVR